MSDKTNFEMSVEQALNLPDSPPMVQPVAPIEVNENADIDDDFATARKNLHQIIHKGNDALEEALLVAKSSEHPRAFEVVGGLIKTLVDANKDLLDIQKKLKDLKKSDDEKAPQSVQAQNAIFVGNAAELQQLINGRK
jgi:flagellar capping protein FliD